MFRWGIMGGGSISSQFAKAINYIDDAEVYALASVSGAGHCGIGAKKYYNTYEALAEDPDIDAVYVGTVHSLHLKCVLACLKTKKPVLCEKPVAINAKEFDRMAELAGQNNTFLMEAVWSRYIPAVIFARDLFLKERYGKIKYLNMTFGYQADPENRRLFDPSLGGGALLDIGVYGINIANFWTGEEPSDIRCFSNLSDEKIDLETGVHFSYLSGAAADMFFSFRRRLPNRAYVVTDEAEFMIPYFWRPDTIFRYRPNGDFDPDLLKERLDFPIECNGYQYEALEVMRRVREGELKSPDMTWDDSANIMRIMDVIRERCGVVYPQDL